MHRATLVAATAATALAALLIWRFALHAPAVHSLDEAALREYVGAYQWGPDAFVYLERWDELARSKQLVALDESGDVRTLYPTGPDRFFAGPGAAVRSEIESHVSFQRGAAGEIVSLRWQREGVPERLARRVALDAREDVRFTHGSLALAGTLITPAQAGRRPAVILVHGSGAADRDAMLPFARFLVRRGMAVLAYD